MSFLEPDHTSRNILIFSVSLIICASLSGFYFFADRGCMGYAEKLKTCTAYKCTQRVKGFPNAHLGKSPASFTREIKGLEKDKFYDFSTCNVVEYDNVDGDYTTFCKYKDKTRQAVIARSGILFGSAPLPEGTQDSHLERYQFAERTVEQQAECNKVEK